MLVSHTPWKRQKILAFPTFWRGIEIKIGIKRVGNTFFITIIIIWICEILISATSRSTSRVSIKRNSSRWQRGLFSRFILKSWHLFYRFSLFNSVNFTSSHSEYRRATGGRPRLPFFENEKSALILEKKALIVIILRLNLPFKM